MAMNKSASGVIPGIISAPATPSKSSNYSPKPNGSSMPAGQINPFVSVPAKGKK